MTPLDIPPGVVNTPTKAKASSNWRETNLIRWSDRVMLPIGGWEQFGYAATSSAIRAVHRWVDNSGNQWIAYLCEDNIYVDVDGALVSINPTIPLAAPAAGFSAGGYGDNVFNYGTYGTARPDVATRKKLGGAFTLDNWGENLIIMSSYDGRLLEWVPNLTPAPAATVANSPLGNTFVVTPERHIIVFSNGADAMAWCDKENNTNWDFTDVASEAGSLPVEPRSPIFAAAKVNDIGNLFFTSRYAYVTSYIGLPYIYNFDQKGDGMIPVSPQAIATIDNGALWFGESGVWKFNGVSIEPITCDIWNWIIDRIGWDEARFMACAVHVPVKSEVWFSFPAPDGTTNSFTAIYNYRSGWWSMAGIGRSAGFASDATNNPLMALGTKVYKHESGMLYPGSELPWAETFNLNAYTGYYSPIANGEIFGTFKQMLPDIEGDANGVRFSLALATERANSAERYSTPRRVQANGKVDFMETARDFRLRVSSVVSPVQNWTFGTTLVDIVPRGRQKK